MTHTQFEHFLESVDLKGYRETYRAIKIVEMDLPKGIQAIDMLYKVYWVQKELATFEDFYQQYLNAYKKDIEAFREKVTMCKDCFYRGLPARIYRTWASIITQIHAGYVAESVFGSGTVEMSSILDRQGADFRVVYREKILNYQVKKKSLGREVRQEKPKSKNPLSGEFIDIKYEVPSDDYFKNPKKKDGDYKLPYKRFMNNKTLKRLNNGFVVFTAVIFEIKKTERDQALE